MKSASTNSTLSSTPARRAASRAAVTWKGVMFTPVARQPNRSAMRITHPPIPQPASMMRSSGVIPTTDARKPVIRRSAVTWFRIPWS
ncbi:hypothetical protein STENM327S_04796 [Streptomyces tendae]